MRTVLFDVGNTLFHLDYAFIADVLAEHGHPVEPAVLRVAEYGAKAAIDRALTANGSLEFVLWRDDAARRPSYFAIDVLGARGAGLAAALIDPLGDYPGAADCPRIRRLADLLELLP